MTGREAALKALGAFRRDGALPDKDFGLPHDGDGRDARETALAAQLFYGVLQNMAYCDYIASVYSTMDLRKLHPHILDILRISIYQILFLTRVPHSAAVNEGVALAKKYSNPRAAGFANAVLRKVSGDAARDNLPQIASDDVIQYLSVKYSHPEWLVREFCGRLGKDGAELLLMAGNSPDLPMTAQVNTLLTDTGAVLSSLAADGADAVEHGWLNGCVLMRGHGRIERLSAFIDGHIYIQDAASRLAAIAAGPKPGDFVIDGCAAPGGKSLAAAILMKNTGRIAAYDVSETKLGMIRESASRLRIGIIEAARQDAREPDAALKEKADVVLADVPCSALGVIRKKPDIRYKAEREIAGLPELQKEILFNLSSYVKPGGTILYSTCTVLKRENVDVVEAFLRERKEFSAAPFTLPGIGEAPGGMITLWPHIHETDGFFICKMVRGQGSGIRGQETK